MALNGRMIDAPVVAAARATLARRAAGLTSYRVGAVRAPAP